MVSKKSSTAKKQPTRAKQAVAAKKSRATKQHSAQKVDIYPNRMTVAVSALAGTVLVLVTVIAAIGSQQ